MKGIRHSEEQIISILKQGEAGLATAELCRQHGITDAELVTLICASNCVFLLREDQSKKQQIAFLRKFLLPAVLARSMLDEPGTNASACWSTWTGFGLGPE